MPQPISIRELGPALVDDYVALFDAALTDNPHWRGCYCAYYDDLCADEDWKPAEQADRNRGARTARILSGDARGLLAYRDGQVVGWCNVAPRNSYANLRHYAEAIEDPDDDPALVMCFVVRPDHRGMGVATALLTAAVQLARSWGSPWLEAYPRKPSADRGPLPWAAASYKGPLSMYLQSGFEITRDVGAGFVVRHTLR